MGLLSWLFGSPKILQTPEELQALKEEESRCREESRKKVEQDIRWASMLHKSLRMLDDFGGVMTDILVLQRDFVTSHPIVRGYACDGTDTPRGYAAGYTARVPMPPAA